MPKTDATYTVNTICDNCHRQGAVKIPRGEAVNRRPCPRCGVTRLRLLDRPTWLSKVISPW